MEWFSLSLWIAFGVTVSATLAGFVSAWFRDNSRAIERLMESELSYPPMPIVNTPPVQPRDNNGGIIEHYSMRDGRRVRDAVVQLGEPTQVITFDHYLSDAEIAGLSQLMHEGVISPAEIRESVTYRGRLITEEQRAMILAHTLPSESVIVPAREPEPASTVENRRLGLLSQ